MTGRSSGCKDGRASAARRTRSSPSPTACCESKPCSSFSPSRLVPFQEHTQYVKNRTKTGNKRAQLFPDHTSPPKPSLIVRLQFWHPQHLLELDRTSTASCRSALSSSTSLSQDLRYLSSCEFRLYRSQGSRGFAVKPISAVSPVTTQLWCTATIFAEALGRGRLR